jgi:hypothetical protein
MSNQPEIIPTRDIVRLIYPLRDQRVILDSDLARIYQVPTKALNQAVKRNRGKFPNDFVFEVSPSEAEDLRRLRSQFVTLKPGRGQHRKYLPYAFTEHGAVGKGERDRHGRSVRRLAEQMGSQIPLTDWCPKVIAAGASAGRRRQRSRRPRSPSATASIRLR